MKRKIIYLVLMLLFLSVASMKARVTIGSDQDPHSGAVLDLSKVKGQNLGLLLPRISLENVTDWQLKGSSDNGLGMLVYNINPNTIGGNGSTGIYIWTNLNRWEPLKV